MIRVIDWVRKSTRRAKDPDPRLSPDTPSPEVKKKLVEFVSLDISPVPNTWLVTGLKFLNSVNKHQPKSEQEGLAAKFISCLIRHMGYVQKAREITIDDEEQFKLHLIPLALQQVSDFFTIPMPPDEKWKEPINGDYILDRPTYKC